jgi:hypothetical protein
METLHHLKTSKSFVEHLDGNKSKEVVDKFIESCLHLDASIFEPYMQEEDVFEDKGKYRFLADLKKLFDKAKMLAGVDFKVNIEDRNCRGCTLGGIVKHFEVVNNKSNNYIGSFGFLIDSEDGMLKNIYRCLNYKETKKVWIQPEGLPGIFTIRHIELDW